MGRPEAGLKIEMLWQGDLWHKDYTMTNHSNHSHLALLRHLIDIVRRWRLEHEDIELNVIADARQSEPVVRVELDAL